jgi:hypothetical protein
MTAPDSARSRASLIPPLLVLLPRFPPSPLLSAGPGPAGTALQPTGMATVLAERARCVPRPAGALASGLDAHHAACAALLIGGR